MLLLPEVTLLHSFAKHSTHRLCFLPIVMFEWVAHELHYGRNGCLYLTTTAVGFFTSCNRPFVYPVACHGVAMHGSALTSLSGICSCVVSLPLDGKILRPNSCVTVLVLKPCVCWFIMLYCASTALYCYVNA